MVKAASLFNLSSKKSVDDSGAPDGGNQADASVVERKCDIAKPKSEKKVKNTNNVKALARNKTNQEAAKPNQGRTAAPGWRASKMVKAASLFNLSTKNSDYDSSAPDGRNQADAFAVEQKSVIVEPKSEKKVKNTKLLANLAKIDEAKESNNQNPASRRALGARRTKSDKSEESRKARLARRRTKSNTPEDSSEKNSIKKLASRRMKCIPMSGIEEELLPEDTEEMKSKKTESAYPFIAL
jgi:hypothetical protein